MGVRVATFQSGTGPVVSVPCPTCGHHGTFESIGVNDIKVETTWLGQRRCPRPECYAHVFYIQKPGQAVETFPAQRIDFDKERIPEKVLKVFEEAITCHADKCYVASAMMIRRTLEQICEDKEASGDNLKKRIQALGHKILIPKELLQGMDVLRLLGNDAAHVEERVFAEVGKNEVEVSITFTKEILKAVYQYGHLLDALEGLKKKDAGETT
jgi:hypothetical protein